MSGNPFGDIEEMLERMSEEFSFPSVGPRVDLVEQDGEFVLKADLPGFDRDDIDLTLRGRQLTLSAETDREDLEEGSRYIRRERERRGYSRSIRLPAEVDPDAVEASFENGVIEVVLPKLEASDQHRIDVE